MDEFNIRFLFLLHYNRLAFDEPKNGLSYLHGFSIGVRPLKPQAAKFRVQEEIRKLKGIERKPDDQWWFDTKEDVYNWQLNDSEHKGH